jgi:hypothetical protein
LTRTVKVYQSLLSLSQRSRLAHFEFFLILKLADSGVINARNNEERGQERGEITGTGRNARNNYQSDFPLFLGTPFLARN